MNVLSLFDGISCGRVALERADIPVKQYFSSEIDKYAITIAQKNFPDTIQLGDVRNWQSWNLPKIDLLIGGSPCQGFSNAGLGLNFDDSRSRLFFVYVDVLNDLRSKNPDLFFLLENVKMRKEWRDVITKFMGINPIEINSALVSAQNRRRLYWTNIPNVQQPEDKHIYLMDILEYGNVDREKSYAIDANYHKGGNPKRYFGKSSRQLVKLATGAAIRNQVTKRGVEEHIRKDEKSNCVVSSYPHKLNGMVQVGLASDIKGFDVTRRIYANVGKSPTLTDMRGGQRQPKVLIRRNGHGFIPTEIKEVEKSDTLREATQHNYHVHKKSKTIRVGGSNSPIGSKQEWNLVAKEDYRRLSVIECERLQTLPGGYTEGVSNTQRYKMLGNAWTVDVVAHIFRSIVLLRVVDIK